MGKMRVFFAVRLNRQTDEQGRSAAWGRSAAGYRAGDELETRLTREQLVELGKP